MVITYRSYCLNCSRFIHEEEDSHFSSNPTHVSMNLAVDDAYAATVVNNAGYQIGAPTSGTPTVAVSGFNTIEDALNYIVASGISSLNPSALGTPTTELPGFNYIEQAILSNQADIVSSSGSLQDQISDNDSDITTIQGNLAAASGSLQSQISSNDSDISNLQSSLTTTSGNLQSDINTRVLRAGDSMTGFLSLHSDPTLSGHASTKKYVDDSFSLLSGSLQDQIDTLEFNQDTQEAYVDTSTSTTSTTFVPLSGMSITPTSGTHYISFSAGMELSNSNSEAEYAIYVDTTPVSQRILRPKSNGRFPVHVQKVISVNGTQPVTLQYRISAGSLTVYTRNLISTKISS